MPAVHYHYGKFPPASLDWERIIPLIGPASAAVARYDGVLSAIPNSRVLLSPLTTDEAVLSSRIEGTRTSLDEVLEYEAAGPNGASPEKEADIHEVLNYRKALNWAMDMLNEIPLCLKLIKGMHKLLLEGVRGRSKSPGEFRKLPNWIGPPGCTIDDAKFVPISADKLLSAMSDWEKYIHENAPDKLVQLALLHAEFEALHPFLDGNGRLGRMFIPLFMFSAGLIGSPMFYISAYFEEKRDEYYDRLLAVSRDDNWTEWCMFFLIAVQTQAESNHSKAWAILNLYNQIKLQISELTRSQFAIHALEWIFKKPVFSSVDFVANSNIPEPTARRILNVLKEADILKNIRIGSGRRPSIFAFPQLVNIAEGKVVL
ncbi:MAG: Fic family protein [bacterium]|jgi:Fic family protein